MSKDKWTVYLLKKTLVKIFKTLKNKFSFKAGSIAYFSLGPPKDFESLTDDTFHTAVAGFISIL